MQGPPTHLEELRCRPSLFLRRRTNLLVSCNDIGPDALTDCADGVVTYGRGREEGRATYTLAGK